MENAWHLLSLGALSAVSMLAAHWFPVRPKGVAAYIYGTGVIVLISLLGFVALPSLSPAVVLVTVAGFAGAATLAAYGVDRLNAQRHALADAKDRVNVINSD